MRWDAVLQAIWTRAKGDATLVSIYTAEYIRKAGGKEFRVPSLEYTLISSTVGELWEPHLVQWDQFTNTMDDLATSDRRLHALFNHELPVFIEGIYMWAQFEDGGDLTGPEREGYYGRASRFRFTPVRERLLAGRSS